MRPRRKHGRQNSRRRNRLPDLKTGDGTPPLSPKAKHLKDSHQGRGGAAGSETDAAEGVTARSAPDPVADRSVGASAGSVVSFTRKGSPPLSLKVVWSMTMMLIMLGTWKIWRERCQLRDRKGPMRGSDSGSDIDDEREGKVICKIWIRGPRSWLPVSRCRSTTLQELRELCAIHLKLSSCAISLCHGEVPLPPHGLCDQYIPMGTVDLWAAPVHMLARVSRPPTAPAPSMRRVEGRCPVCQTGAQCEVEKLDDQMTEMEETLYMVENDKNVQTVNVQHHKKLVKLQYYQGCTVGGLRATYAKVKKIGKERIRPYPGSRMMSGHWRKETVYYSPWRLQAGVVQGWFICIFKASGRSMSPLQRLRLGKSGKNGIMKGASSTRVQNSTTLSRLKCSREQTSMRLTRTMVRL